MLLKKNTFFPIYWNMSKSINTVKFAGKLGDTAHIGPLVLVYDTMDPKTYNTYDGYLIITPDKGFNLTWRHLLKSYYEVKKEGIKAGEDHKFLELIEKVDRSFLKKKYLDEKIRKDLLKHYHLMPIYQPFCGS